MLYSATASLEVTRSASVLLSCMMTLLPLCAVCNMTPFTKDTVVPAVASSNINTSTPFSFVCPKGTLVLKYNFTFNYDFTAVTSLGGVECGDGTRSQAVWGAATDDQWEITTPQDYYDPISGDLVYCPSWFYVAGFYGRADNQGLRSVGLICRRGEYRYVLHASATLVPT